MLRPLAFAAVFALAAHGTGFAQDAPAAQTEKPNILVIFGDDIGQTNLSIYSRA